MSVWQKLKDGNELVRFKFLVFEDHKLLFFRIYIGKNIVDVNYFFNYPSIWSIGINQAEVVSYWTKVDL